MTEPCTRRPRPTFIVIPCGADKLDAPAAARDLYVGSMFRHTLAAAEAEAPFSDATILVLSAKYGLVTLDTVLAPYNVKMGDDGTIPTVNLIAQAFEHGIEWGADVYGFLPRAYFERLDAALRQIDVYAADVYEATAGIGEQRGVNRCVREAA